MKTILDHKHDWVPVAKLEPGFWYKGFACLKCDKYLVSLGITPMPNAQPRRPAPPDVEPEQKVWHDTHLDSAHPADGPNCDDGCTDV